LISRGSFAGSQSTNHKPPTFLQCHRDCEAFGGQGGDLPPLNRCGFRKSSANPGGRGELRRKTASESIPAERAAIGFLPQTAASEDIRPAFTFHFRRRERVRRRWAAPMVGVIAEPAENRSALGLGLKNFEACVDINEKRPDSQFPVRVIYFKKRIRNDLV